MEISRGRGYVYGIEYRIVFCTKYRKKIIDGFVKENLIRCILLLADELKIKILEINTNLDHVHLLISCAPQHYLPSIVKRLKGTTALWLFRLHPELKNELWGGHLWNPSYFVCTVSETTEENIANYIKSQGG